MFFLSKLTNKLKEMSEKEPDTAEYGNRDGRETWMKHSQEEIFDEAQNLIDNGMYEEAVKRLVYLENEGNGDASSKLGYMYFTGEGVVEDYDLATMHLRNALNSGSDHNDSGTSYYIGNQYLKGQGKPIDYEKAVLWFFRSAIGRGAFVLGMFSVGDCYAHGRGVPQNYSEAARWYEMCINNTEGKDEALAHVLYNLGMIYIEGMDVDADFEKGMGYVQRAAAAGHERAAYYLRNMN